MGLCLSAPEHEGREGPYGLQASEQNELIHNETRPADAQQSRVDALDATNASLLSAVRGTSQQVAAASSAEILSNDPFRQLKTFQECTENIVGPVEEVLSDLKLLRPLAQGGYGTCYEGAVRDFLSASWLHSMNHACCMQMSFLQLLCLPMMDTHYRVMEGQHHMCSEAVCDSRFEFVCESPQMKHVFVHTPRMWMPQCMVHVAPCHNLREFLSLPLQF